MNIYIYISFEPFVCVRAAPSEPESRFFLSPPLWILFTKLWTSDECLHLFSLCKYDFSFDFFSIWLDFFFFDAKVKWPWNCLYFFCLFLRFKTTGWRCNAQWWQGVARVGGVFSKGYADFFFLFHFIFFFFFLEFVATHTHRSDDPRRSLT